MSITQQQYMKGIRDQFEIFQKNSKYISKKNAGISVPPGWIEIIKELFSMIQSKGYTDVQIQQIKEKFGGLRIYFEGGDEELVRKTIELEKESYRTCEICGYPGEVVNTGGWIRTRCHEHHNSEWPTLDERQFSALQKEYTAIRKKFAPEVEL